MSSMCPFCHICLPFSVLEWHANGHFADKEPAKDMELAQQIPLSSQSLKTLNIGDYVETSNVVPGRAAEPSTPIHNSAEHRVISEKEHIACLAAFQTKGMFYKIAHGLIPLLRRCLESEKGAVKSVITGHIDHYQSLMSEDYGWGCGWRNIQMLSSHLLMQRQEARDSLYGGAGFVPDISSLQRWLEIAWERGFDEPGSDSFKQKICGSKEWIGTTECAALLRSFGLRARIVDFDSLSTSSALMASSNRLYDSNTKKQKTKGHQVLVNWVWKYFTGEDCGKLDNPCVLVSEKTPLYFQHDGHSRTIIGIQMKKGRRGSEDIYSLLVLDPEHRTEDLERSLTKNKGWQKLIKHGVHSFQKPQYQLCYVDPGVAHGKELEQLKTIDSIYVKL